MCGKCFFIFFTLPNRVFFNPLRVPKCSLWISGGFYKRDVESFVEVLLNWISTARLKRHLKKNVNLCLMRSHLSTNN